LWAVDIDEQRDQAGQRTWDVQVDTASSARDAKANAQEQRQQKKKEETLQRHLQSLRDAFIGVGRSGLTKSEAFTRAGLNHGKGTEALGRLLRDGILEECKVEKNGREYDGFRLSSTYSDNSDNT
jgi:hypothetical protein